VSVVLREPMRFVQACTPDRVYLEDLDQTTSFIRIYFTIYLWTFWTIKSFGWI